MSSIATAKVMPLEIILLSECVSCNIYIVTRYWTIWPQRVFTLHICVCMYILHAQIYRIDLCLTHETTVTSSEWEWSYQIIDHCFCLLAADWNTGHRSSTPKLIWEADSFAFGHCGFLGDIITKMQPQRTTQESHRKVSYHIENTNN